VPDRKTMVWLLAILLVVVLLSPLASQAPDGLERVAEDKGFIALAEGQEVWQAPMAEYLFPGLTHEGLATAMAGIAGVLLVFLVVVGLGKAVGRNRGRDGRCA